MDARFSVKIFDISLLFDLVKTTEFFSPRFKFRINNFFYLQLGARRLIYSKTS